MQKSRISPDILIKDGFSLLHRSSFAEINKKDTFRRRYSNHIFWQDLLKEESLRKLPKNKTILLVCYVGHTASQMLVALSLLGYKVKALKFGTGKSPVEGVPVAGWLDYGFELES